MATANTPNDRSAYQLSGKASITFRSEKRGTQIVRFRQAISEADYKALPKRQQAFFKQVKSAAPAAPQQPTE